MEKLPKKVTVLDVHDAKLQNTDVGKARRLLRARKAEIISRQPFVIRLK